MSDTIPPAQQVVRGAKTIVAILIAPPVIGIAIGVAFLVLVSFLTAGAHQSPVGDVMSELLPGALGLGAALGAIVGSSTVLIVGTLTRRTLRQRKLDRPRPILICSFLCALVLSPLAPLFLVFVWWTTYVPLDPWEWLLTWAGMLPFLLLGGTFSGLAFWLIRRPDKDPTLTHSPSPPT